MSRLQIEACQEAGADECENPFLTARVVLRGPKAEACWSAHSVNLGGLVVPNRDYAAEGFNAIIAGKQVKILDAIAVGIRDVSSGNLLGLTPGAVIITPWSAEHRYCFSAPDSENECALSVRYVLGMPPHPVLHSVFSSDCALEQGQLNLVASPLAVLDCFSQSRNASRISSKAVGATRLVCESPVAAVELHSPQGIGSRAGSAVQNWHYKLGWGERRVEGGKITPSGADGTCNIAGELGLPFPHKGKTCELWAVAYSPSGALPFNSAPASHDEAHFAGLFSEICREFSPELIGAESLWGGNAPGRLAARMYHLAHSFRLDVNGFLAYDAGAMWFRQSWLRDAMEAIFSNFEFFFRLDRKGLRDYLLWALSMQDSRGLLPNFVGSDGSSDYRSLDASLLCFLCCCKYLRGHFDSELARRLSSCISAFQKSASAHGHDVRMSFGLLSCPANYSWIDSVVPLQTENGSVAMPCRIPRSWFDGTTARQTADIACANYFLVETNAQWVAILREANALGLPGVSKTGWLYKIASRNFSDMFRRGSLLCDIVPEHADVPLADSGFCSASLVAYSLLPGHFSQRDLSRAFLEAQANFAYRGGKLFGVPVRAGRLYEDEFLGDFQYHGSTCWPRDAPYLFDLLASMGRDDLAGQLLASSLDHQAEESAIGYCGEVFAIGRDRSVTPVKNPAQFWSCFVSPYLRFVPRRAASGREQVAQAARINA
jgi:hypothetical protein